MRGQPEIGKTFEANNMKEINFWVGLSAPPSARKWNNSTSTDLRSQTSHRNKKWILDDFLSRFQFRCLFSSQKMSVFPLPRSRMMQPRSQTLEPKMPVQIAYGEVLHQTHCTWHACFLPITLQGTDNWWHIASSSFSSGSTFHRVYCFHIPIRTCLGPVDDQVLALQWQALCEEQQK